MIHPYQFPKSSWIRIRKCRHKHSDSGSEYLITDTALLGSVDLFFFGDFLSRGLDAKFLNIQLAFRKGVNRHTYLPKSIRKKGTPLCERRIAGSTKGSIIPDSFFGSTILRSDFRLSSSSSLHLSKVVREAAFWLIRTISKLILPDQPTSLISKTLYYRSCWKKKIEGVSSPRWSTAWAYVEGLLGELVIRTSSIWWVCLYADVVDHCLSGHYILSSTILGDPISCTSLLTQVPVLPITMPVGQFILSIWYQFLRIRLKVEFFNAMLLARV